MKKIFVVGITVLILSFGFISCSSDDDNDGGGEIPVEFRGTYTNTSGGTHTLVIGATSATLTRSGQSPVTKPFGELYEAGGGTYAAFFSGSWSNPGEHFLIQVDPSNNNIISVTYIPAGGVAAIVGSGGTWTKQ